MTEASAVAQLPEELRRVVWRHAVDLYAYYGKPVEQLSQEQITLWLGFRAEFAQRGRDACDVRIRVGSAPLDVSAERIREAVGLASKDGDLQAARDAAKVIAEAATPLKPLDLREQVRELLMAHPLSEVLLEIDRELIAYADHISDQEHNQYRASEAVGDAKRIRLAFAELSLSSKSPRQRLGRLTPS